MESSQKPGTTTLPSISQMEAGHSQPESGDSQPTSAGLYTRKDSSNTLSTPSSPQHNSSSRQFSNASTSTISDARTASTSRRLSDDKKAYHPPPPPPPPPLRQSLPSLHEALGERHPSGYFSQPPPPPPPPSHHQTSSPSYQLYNRSGGSPTPQHERSHFSNSRSEDLHSAQTPLGVLAAAGSYAQSQAVNGSKPSSSVSQPPLTNSFQAVNSRSHEHYRPWETGSEEQPPRQPRVSNPNHPSYVAYDHTPLTNNYSTSIPPLPAESSSGYSKLTSSPPRLSSGYRLGQETEKTSPPRTYGESVKRHLESFDLESSLTEISNGSKRLQSFSNHYGDRAHQTQRSGPLPGSTPNLTEIEDMIREGNKIQDSLYRLREVILSQQAALAQRSLDQKMKGQSSVMAEESTNPRDDTKGGGGFAGGDPKKRRGRAAPPGRCHSCNRAETPEWRRGPDGARTLCNACGLHYAKLTRKMASNKSGSVGSSNQKGKADDPASPTSV